MSQNVAHLFKVRLCAALRRNWLAGVWPKPPDGTSGMVFIIHSMCIDLTQNYAK